MSERISSKVKPGVAAGKDLQEIFAFAKAGHFALPAVNVVGSNSVNGVMEAAKAVNSPVIIQFSNGVYSLNYHRYPHYIKLSCS